MPKREATEDVDVDVPEASVSALPTVKRPKKPLPPGYKCNCCGALEEHAVYGKTMQRM
jgi:hypothetical protein